MGFFDFLSDAASWVMDKIEDAIDWINDNFQQKNIMRTMLMILLT